MAQTFTEQPPLNAPNLVKTPVPPTPDKTPPTTPPPAAKVEDKKSIETPVVKIEDILKRSITPPAEPQTETSYREDLEKISDPAIKAIAEKQLKDLESGYNKKFQTLAQEKKELEAFRNKISTWTPQRLQDELRNPAFVQAMQSLQSQTPPNEWTGTSDSWSSLSDTEKEEFQRLRQVTYSLQSQVATLLHSQEDVEIKKLYPDYDSQVVNEAIEGLRTGQITASRADIWKVVNHDNNVQKGYKGGYEDGYQKALDKMNGSSITSSNGQIAPANEVPDDVRKKGFASIAMWRLERMRNGQKK